MKNSNSYNSIQAYLANHYCALGEDDFAAQQAKRLHERFARRDRTPVLRQQIEKAIFKFNYQPGEPLVNFEHFYGRTPKEGQYGVIQTIPICNEFARPEAGIIDWVDFTFRIDPSQDREDIVRVVSRELQAVFGFGVTQERKAGLNFYEHSYEVGNKWGYLCIGGQRNTLLVMINGSGCSAACKGWLERLYDWGLTLPRFKITRVDVAYDCFNGEYSVDRAVVDYDEGYFKLGGRPPKIEQRGNWRIPEDEGGRSVFIGSRDSGKYCRIYEKGKQLGDSKNPWVRIECEWHSTNRDIPNDILITPGKYLAGAYPAFMWISEVQEVIRTITKKTQITYERMVKDTRKQLGPFISYMMEKEGSLKKVFKKLARPGIPKRLIVPDWRDAKRAIHEDKITLEDRQQGPDEIIEISRRSVKSLVSKWQDKAKSREEFKALKAFLGDFNALFET